MTQQFEKYNEVTVPFNLKLVVRAGEDDPENGLSEASQAQVIEFIQKLAELATVVSMHGDHRPEQMSQLLDVAKEAVETPHISFVKFNELMRQHNKTQTAKHPTLTPFIAELMAGAHKLVSDHMIASYPGPKEVILDYLQKVYDNLINRGVA
jgi:hypothetical protein